jgi:pyruvate/2-oxoacid:ferredoxin oxidoreductase beta subunit
LNYDPKDKKKPIEEFFKLQGRFKHLLLPENAELLKEIQNHIDKDWERLKKLSGQ